MLGAAWTVRYSPKNGFSNKCLWRIDGWRHIAWKSNTVCCLWFLRKVCRHNITEYQCWHKYTGSEQHQPPKCSVCTNLVVRRSSTASNILQFSKFVPGQTAFNDRVIAECSNAWIRAVLKHVFFTGSFITPADNLDNFRQWIVRTKGTFRLPKFKKYILPTRNRGIMHISSSQSHCRFFSDGRPSTTTQATSGRIIPTFSTHEKEQSGQWYVSNGGRLPGNSQSGDCQHIQRLLCKHSADAPDITESGAQYTHHPGGYLGNW